MKKFLTNDQVVEYKALHRKCKHPQRADRIKAILMLNKGFTPVQISDALLIDSSTVYDWKNQYLAGGIEMLLKNHYMGGQSLLKKCQEEALSDHLEKHIYGSSKEVCMWVEKNYQVCYSIQGMTALLHRLDFSYKKPKHIPSKANLEAQEAFIKQYETLKKDKADKDRIYFMDGTHPMHNSQPAYGWIKKKKEKPLKSNSGRERLNINGAYNVEDAKVIVREDASINGQSTTDLLEQMLKEQPQGQIHVILDNASYYHCEHVTEFLKKNPRIEFLFLPPYSPNLNLIERLWKFFKKKVTYNTYYEKFAVFRQKCMNFFQNMDQHRSALKTLMREKFHLIQA